MSIHIHRFSKAAAIVAGAGLVLSSFALAIPAGAQTTTTTTTTTASATTFSRDLTIGSTGADVTALQAWLISKGFSIPAGATGYFGMQTKAAVAAYQAANGITPAAGYFGPITRAKVNAGGGVSTGGSTVPGCAPGAMFSSTTGASCSGGSTGGSTSGGALSGGEANLRNYDLISENGTVNESESGAEIATAKFDVDNGDVRIERAELTVHAASSTLEDKPWKYFDNVSVWMDGKNIGDVDASSRDAWDEQNADDFNGGSDNEYTITIDSLSSIVREGDKAELTFAVDVNDSIDSADLDQTFETAVLDDGIRAVDSQGIDQYTGDSGDSVDVDFGATDNGDLSVRSNTDDPDSTVLIADNNNESAAYDVFVFDVRNKGDADSNITDLTLHVATTGASVSSLIRHANLSVDGNDYDGDINNGDGTIDFNNIDVTVGNNDSQTFTLSVRLARNAPAGTLRFTANGADIDAEGSDSGDNTDVTGSASSNSHTVALTGIVATNGDSTTSTNDTQTVGTYRMTFTVDALEDDAYIYKGADQGDNDATPFSAMASTTGIAYNIYSDGGVIAATTSDSALLQSSADTSGNYFVVHSGDSETFTLTVTLDPAGGSGTHLYFVELDAIRFDDNTTAGTVDDNTYLVPDESEFETDAESLVA
jgi:hypothetical protein